MRDHDWWKENDDAILFHGCETLAVFFNGDANVTLRQQDQFGDDDVIITVPLDSADRLAARILACAAEGRAARNEQKADHQPDAQQRLALPAPNGKHTAPPVRNGGAGTATKMGAAHG
jgi:hypothetical protein